MSSEILEERVLDVVNLLTLLKNDELSSQNGAAEKKVITAFSQEWY